MDREKIHVMIVEDSKLITERIINVLEGLQRIGKITHTETYFDALTLIENEVPDVVVLDIGLPDRSGIYLLQVIKQRQWKTRVIIFTNEANEFYKRLCLRNGADVFLDKSHDFDKVANIIQNL